MREVYKIYKSDEKHWVGDGFFVKQIFSHMKNSIVTTPFLLFDYVAPNNFEPNLTNTPRGVGVHPHKGFETVTIAYCGEIEHKDSSGAGGIIYPGDVQWMTAGAGIVHQEFHSENFSKKGGTLQMVQLWVNLPKKDKNTPPKYQHLTKESIPTITLENNKASIRLIAGEYNNKKGAASTFTNINLWDITINKDENISLDIPSNHNLMIFVLQGEVVFNNKDVARSEELVKFVDKDGIVNIKAKDNQAKVLLLSGGPIDEPVVGYGPFVMNSQSEIKQAILDYNSGKFGEI